LLGGSVAEGGYNRIGDTVNVAARLCSRQPSDRLDHGLRRKAHDARTGATPSAYREARFPRAEGKGGTVRCAYEAVRPGQNGRGRRAQAANRVRRRPFVRDASTSFELLRLCSIRASCASKAPQLVTVTGQPGVGQVAPPRDRRSGGAPRTPPPAAGHPASVTACRTLGTGSLMGGASARDSWARRGSIVEDPTPLTTPWHQQDVPARLRRGTWRDGDPGPQPGLQISSGWRRDRSALSAIETSPAEVTQRRRRRTPRRLREALSRANPLLGPSSGRHGAGQDGHSSCGTSNWGPTTACSTMIEHLGGAAGCERHLADPVPGGATEVLRAAAPDWGGRRGGRDATSIFPRAAC